jgi:hypothetical protein
MDPFNSLRRVLNTRAVQAAAAAGLPADKFELPNEDFVTPKGQIYGGFWHRIGGSRQAELGGRRGFEMSVGIYQFDILVPENKGDGPGLAIADKIRRNFNRREMVVEPDGHLKLLVANVKTPFSGPQNGFWRVIVDGEFHYYYKDPQADGFRD